MIYALEYYIENGDCPFGVGEDESSGINITTEWNGEKVGEKVEEVVAGDANCDGVMNMADAVLIMQNLSNPDGNVNMADAVLIMQSLANPDKYGVNGTDETHITSLGEKNGDMDGNGLTNADALEIQKMLLKIS